MKEQVKPEKLLHRGRFQAQGKNLEKSESWAQDDPLLYEDGVTLLNNLEKGLSQKDKFLRAQAFEKCRKFIKNASENGGLSVQEAGKRHLKSYVVRYSERLDLEVNSGKAFILKREPANGEKTEL